MCGSFVVAEVTNNENPKKTKYVNCVCVLWICGNIRGMVTIAFKYHFFPRSIQVFSIYEIQTNSLILTKVNHIVPSKATITSRFKTDYRQTAVNDDTKFDINIRLTLTSNLLNVNWVFRIGIPVILI